MLAVFAPDFFACFDIFDYALLSPPLLLYAFAFHAAATFIDVFAALYTLYYMPYVTAIASGVIASIHMPHTRPPSHTMRLRHYASRSRAPLPLRLRCLRPAAAAAYAHVADTATDICRYFDISADLRRRHYAAPL